MAASPRGVGVEGLPNGPEGPNQPSAPVDEHAPGTPAHHRQANPNGFEGSWALPLTFLSNVLHSFGGGPGRIAIHGRGGASLSDPLGTARSHGCIRIDNRAVDWLAHHVRRF